MQAMKGATQALGSMNRTMNLPALQRIAMEFERENDIMEQRQEMMDDVMDDAMDVGAEEEGEEVVEQVLEEIGIDLTASVSLDPGAGTRFRIADGSADWRNADGPAGNCANRGQGCGGSWRWRPPRRCSAGQTRQSEEVALLLGWVPVVSCQRGVARSFCRSITNTQEHSRVRAHQQQGVSTKVV